MDRFRPLPRFVLVALASVFCTTFSPTELRAQPFANAPEPAVEAERLLAEKQAQAAETSLVSPVFSVSEGEETELYLLNLVTENVLVELVIRSPDGDSLPLGRILLEPNRHRQISLKERLAAAEEKFYSGSVTLTFLGDADTVQAWVVLRRGGEILELPFTAPAKLSSGTHVSFWSLQGHGDGEAKLYLFNNGFRALSYLLEISASSGARQEVLGEIAPGAREALTMREIVPSAVEGWLELSHDGEPGDLAVSAFLEGARTLLALPLLAPGDLHVGEAYHGLGLRAFREPDRRGLSGSVVLFNASSSRQNVAVEMLPADGGLPLGSRRVELGPHEIHKISLPQLGDANSIVGEARLRVEGEGALAVYGYQILEGGSLADIAFFSESQAHASGSYPLPPLESYDVATTVVNLGAEPAALFAQYYWRGGTYALGPIEVAPGAMLELDPSELAGAGRGDILGRELPTDYEEGYVKWLAKGESPKLIGRTQVRPRSGEDRFGFNCFGCCWDIPSGSIIPGVVEFLPGQTVAFQACISYSTCNGVMGPYPYNPSFWSSPSPFSWDTRVISASGAAEATLDFEGTEFETGPNCSLRQREVRGSGKGDTCKAFLFKNHNAYHFWDKDLACTQQVGDRPAGQKRCNSCQECCNKQKAYQKCKGASENVLDSEYRTCSFSCTIDHCT